MKRTFLIVVLSLLLAACGSDAEVQTEQTPEKREEMSQAAALVYLEEVTYRYVDGAEMPVGSFEQKSELEAGIARSESVIEEIETEYVTDSGLPKEIIELAELTRKACQDILDGNYEADYDNSYAIGKKLAEISNTYLDGEMPPTIKHKVID